MQQGLQAPRAQRSIPKSRPASNHFLRNAKICRFALHEKIYLQQGLQAPALKYWKLFLARNDFLKWRYICSARRCRLGKCSSSSAPPPLPFHALLRGRRRHSGRAWSLAVSIDSNLSHGTKGLQAPFCVRDKVSKSMLTSGKEPISAGRQEVSSNRGFS